MKKLLLITIAALCFAEEPKIVPSVTGTPAWPAKIQPAHASQFQALSKEFQELQNRLKLLRYEVCDAAGLLNNQCEIDWARGIVSKAQPKAEAKK